MKKSSKKPARPAKKTAKKPVKKAASAGKKPGKAAKKTARKSTVTAAKKTAPAADAGMSLLDGALRVGGSVLVYGPGAPVAKIVKLVQTRTNAAAPIDVRDAAKAPAERELRRLAGDRTAGKSGVICLVGHEVPPHVRGVLSELCDHQLNVAPGDVRRLDDELCVVVISPDAHPAAELSSMFELHIAADRALAPASAAQRV